MHPSIVSWLYSSHRRQDSRRRASYWVWWTFQSRPRLLWTVLGVEDSDPSPDKHQRIEGKHRCIAQDLGSHSTTRLSACGRLLTGCKLIGTTQDGPQQESISTLPHATTHWWIAVNYLGQGRQRLDRRSLQYSMDPCYRLFHLGFLLHRYSPCF